MKRAIFYIDGFNLFNGIRKTGKQFLKWLDIQKLSENVLCMDAKNQGEYANLVAVKFFTAKLTKPESYKDEEAKIQNEEKIKRQRVYRRAVETLDKTEIIYGRFFNKSIWCSNCERYHEGYEEKRTDVNIASELLSDAYKNKFDFAYVVSGDSDLLRPIQIVAKMKEKEAIVVFPPHRGSIDLARMANRKIRLKSCRLENCIFPYRIEPKKGKHVICMPDKWRKDAPTHIMEQVN